ncbi:prepilin peptidase [Kushneria aurantia]|uniref:Prepilin leader peptidase/N-methyltransferase n=1 Tax=Kushneria aurantia TaxID=504092 RepID=A0ABV6FZV2_9GAMM|nr:A24 family peptidase [Kushneria aurantia]
MTPLLLLLVAALGLVLGSFVNVVIARLPVMIARDWRAQARETLSLSAENEVNETFNLAVPRSHCPHCRTPIAWHDNLPLLGYLKRRGRCAGCGSRISVQYPLVELAAMGLALWLTLAQGVSVESAALLGGCLTLLALAVIDLHTRLLPDALTLPLLWAGLLYQLIWQPQALSAAVVGAAAGYLFCWSFYWLFRLMTGREGMGYGDFKLLAALGAWCGWQALPLLLVLSAGVGAIVGIAIQLALPRLRGAPLPFGPFLGAAGVLMVIEGDALMALYNTLLGAPAGY